MGKVKEWQSLHKINSSKAENIIINKEKQYLDKKEIFDILNKIIISKDAEIIGDIIKDYSFSGYNLLIKALKEIKKGRR